MNKKTFPDESVIYPEVLECYREEEWGSHGECSKCRFEWQCRYNYYDERY